MIARTQRPTAQAGGALLFALLIVTFVSALALGMLTLSGSVTQQHTLLVDQKRAFYLAEAGISQAYFGLTTGMTGAIGTMERPAAYGDGLLWVEVEDLGDGFVRLESTAACGTGRATQAVNVERIEEPLGFFSDRELILDAPLLLDGYDPEEGSYYEQVEDGGITIDRGYPYLFIDEENQILFYEEIFYRFLRVDGDTFTYDAVLDHKAHPELGIDWDDFVDDFEAYGDDDEDEIPTGPYAGNGGGGDFEDEEYEIVLEYFAAIPRKAAPVDPAAPSMPIFGGLSGLGSKKATAKPSGSDSWFFSQLVVPEPPTDTGSTLGPTTGGGGALGSNEGLSIGELGQHIEIYGDVRSGPDAEIGVGANAVITGQALSRTQLVELPAVRVPDVQLKAAVTHSDTDVALTIPPSTTGYQSITVRSDAELELVGPSTIVVARLVLENGSALTIENTDGAVNLFVTESVSLAPGARLIVRSDKTANLTLQIAGAETSTFRATSKFYGAIYAPQATVEVGAGFEVFGQIVGGQLALDSGVRLHFDSGYRGNQILPRLLSWRIMEVPAAVRRPTSDPFQQLGVTATDLIPMQEAQTTTSCTLRVMYRELGAGLFETVTYEGPFENWDFTEAEAIHWMTVTPPSATVEGEWRISMRYVDFFGVERTYDGPLTNLPVFMIRGMMNMVILPPAGL